MPLSGETDKISVKVLSGYKGCWAVTRSLVEPHFLALAEPASQTGQGY